MSGLDDFLAMQDLDHIFRVRRWRIERVPEVADQIVGSLFARDGAAYRLLMVCNGLPGDAPSVAFVDENRNKTAPSAWPKGTGAFHEIVKPPPNCFLCTGLTREGLAHHPDWKTGVPLGAWTPGHHTILDIMSVMQTLLNSPGYLGRGP